MFYIFGAVLLFILDQITKLLTVQNFSLYESVTVIKGVLDFTRHHNTGGPWSLFDSHIEVFVIITFVIFLLEFLYFKKRPMKHPLERFL
ncbi:MAG: signal peptidase II [Clostridia bacterium]|nr:signal peptidase II [Clostridia bacterium]